MSKGQIEVTFNWLFVMIAGAAIMFFFYNLINFEVDSTRDQIDRTVSERVRSVFSSLGSTSDSFQIQRGFSQVLEFSCLENSHRFGIQGASSDVELRSELVFTPPLLGGGELLSSSKSLRIPYKVENVVYLADRSTRYIFINDAGQFNDFEEDFETRNLDTEKLALSSLEESGYRLTVFILPDGFQENSLEEEDFDFDYSVVSVVDFDDLQFNNAIFRRGFILSGGSEVYDCVERKAFEQIKISSAIYANRTEKVFDQSSQFCRGILLGGDVLSILNDFSKGDLSPEGVSALESTNSDLDRGGCAWIY